MRDKKHSEQPVTFKIGHVTGMRSEGKGSDLNSRSLGSYGTGKNSETEIVVCLCSFSCWSQNKRNGEGKKQTEEDKSVRTHYTTFTQ